MVIPCWFLVIPGDSLCPLHPLEERGNQALTTSPTLGLPNPAQGKVSDQALGNADVFISSGEQNHNYSRSIFVFTRNAMNISPLSCLTFFHWVNFQHLQYPSARGDYLLINFTLCKVSPLFWPAIISSTHFLSFQRKKKKTIVTLFHPLHATHNLIDYYHTLLLSSLIQMKYSWSTSLFCTFDHSIALLHIFFPSSAASFLWEEQQSCSKHSRDRHALNLRRGVIMASILISIPLLLILNIQFAFCHCHWARSWHIHRTAHYKHQLIPE